MKSNAVWRWACFILLYWELYFCYKNKIKQKHLCSILTLICIALAHSACIQIYICGGYWNQNPSISCQGKLAKFAAYWFSQRPEFLSVCEWLRFLLQVKALGCDGSNSLSSWLENLGLHEYLQNFLSSGYRTLDCVRNLWELEIVNVSHSDVQGQWGVSEGEISLQVSWGKKKIRIGKRVWQFTSGSPPKLKQEAKTEGECVFVLNIGKWILKSHSKKINWDFHVWKQELKLLG